jgi:hypothetical protein
MLYYLDTVIVVYAVEGNPADQQRALNHLAVLEQAGHGFALSDLTRTECLVPVFGPGEGQRLSDFFRFFHGPNLRTVSLTAAMLTRASAIRGAYTYAAVPAAPPKRTRCLRCGRPLESNNPYVYLCEECTFRN